MNNLSNIFSLLEVDAEDDREQISTLPDSRDEDVASRSDTDRKSELSGEGETLKNDKLLKENLLMHPDEYRMPLVWIDLEMTGLDIEVDRILEIACVITDGKLTKSVEGPDLVIKQSKECLDKMGEWCQEHHAASGLTNKVLQSTVTEKDAEEQVVAAWGGGGQGHQLQVLRPQVIQFVKKHVGSYGPLLAGNSVYVDLIFLKKYMPDLAGIFSHVLVDVSSVTALCTRWFPKDRKRAPAKEQRHRAMDDIKESIKELQYYKETIFKGTARSRQ